MANVCHLLIVHTYLCLCLHVRTDVERRETSRKVVSWLRLYPCKRDITPELAALNDSSDLSSRPDIQMHTYTHLHTPTRSVLICLNTHGSDARARSGPGRLPTAAIISRQILFF